MSTNPGPEEQGGAHSAAGSSEEREIEIGGLAYRAVLIDLDGTLLTTEGKVSPRTAEVLQAIRKRDVRVMVVTGRSVSSAVAAVEELNLDTPISCFNGGSLYCARKRQLLRNIVLDEGVAATVMRDLVEAEIDFFANRLERKWTLPGKHPEYAGSIARFDDVDLVSSVEQIPTSDINRITILGTAELVKEFRVGVAERHGKLTHIESFHLSALPTHRDYTLFVCDVHPPGRGKAEAVHYLESEYGILRQDIIAIGDGRNDLPMIRAAGLGVAMEGSHAQVLEEADRVIGGHDDDGVARFLEELFLSES